MNRSQVMSKAKWALSWACSAAQEEPSHIESVRSNEANEVFRLSFSSRTLFLKIGPALDREYERLKWLEGRLPAPVAIGHVVGDSEHALLTSAIEGQDLAGLSATLPPEDVITRLAGALRTLHSTNTAGWPFGGSGVLVHGDACLPNFLFAGCKFTGYIDLGEMALGDPEVDLSAAVWSLQYNLGPGHGMAFLQQYGIANANDEYEERLRLRYE